MGETLGGQRYWHGPSRTQWARDWVKLWTGGQGVFAMTNMESQSLAGAMLTASKQGLVDMNRVLVLRTASNPSTPPPGKTALDSVGDEGPGQLVAYESNYRVGAPVVHELLNNWDRYRVRLAEMRESVRIIEQAIDGLPEGPWVADDRKVVLPPRHELGTSMEALIHHFKLVTEGFRVPPGEVYFPVEGPRGEYAVFLVADGSSKPVRVHMRDPSFVNLQALREMCVGGYVADLIANLAMLDPILGGIDR